VASCDPVLVAAPRMHDLTQVYVEVPAGEADQRVVVSLGVLLKRPASHP
jgi:hypothetical protein